jgi:hypothetical protein
VSVCAIPAILAIGISRALRAPAATAARADDMRSWVLWSGLLILLAGAAVGPGAPLDPETRAVEGKVEPYRDLNYERPFRAGTPAKVIAVGKTGAPLGLYVFDANGNCVARDDDVGGRSRDEVAVEWVPAQTGPCTIQVKALGKNGDEFLMTVRQGGAS